jgi:hypothetical protein
MKHGKILFISIWLLLDALFILVDVQVFQDLLESMPFMAIVGAVFVVFVEILINYWFYIGYKEYKTTGHIK